MHELYLLKRQATSSSRDNRTILFAFTAIMTLLLLLSGQRVSAVTSASTEVSTAQAASVRLKSPKMTTVTRKKKGTTTVKWNKVSNATGYELQYSTDQSFSSAKTVKINKGSTTSKKLSSLSSSKDTYLRIRATKGSSVSAWSPLVKLVVWHSSWTYAKNSKIHSDPAILYYTTGGNKKNITVAINAGHGCSGGSSKKTLCHPNGTGKVTGGSTSAGATYATAINEGTTVSGMSEASANLKIALKLKSKLLSQGYNVLMIRQDSNTQLDNIARTVMANNNANCHIAIHFDSTTSNKGAFYISVPNVSSYRNMTPVKQNWKKHNKLGSKLVSGLKSSGIKIMGSGSMAIDLTQTSYSTIASVDIEVGDKATSTSDANLSKIASGLAKGVNSYFK